MSATQVTVITVIGQIGALIGSTLMGYLSTFTGRRLAMMVACVFGGAIVPAYMLPRGDKLIASVFFEQWFVGAVWGKCRMTTTYKVLTAMKLTIIRPNSRPSDRVEPAGLAFIRSRCHLSTR